MKFNKRFNRYESDIDHHYAPFNYAGCNYLESKPYKGKIKCRLVHEEGNSIVFPDFIFLRNGWIQPLQFTAPLLGKHDENLIVCDFFIDIQGGETVKIRFFKDKLLDSYVDKSQLFECEIYGPVDIEEYASGEYETIDNKIYLKLFHHTNDVGYNGITNSKSLRSSRWNYRGSKECINYHFVYFTHIPEMKVANDLITVAMSAEGNIDYVIDSFIRPILLPSNFRDVFNDFIYIAKVYRSTTGDRNHSITFLVAIDHIDIKHVYHHYQAGAPFYEICFPYIHRIKTKPGSVLPFNNHHVIEATKLIVNSDYSIIGDARYKDGLAAPFEEEETKYIFKIEDCGPESIPEFWFNHGNQDLYTEKKAENLKLNDVDNNPTK